MAAWSCSTALSLPELYFWTSSTSLWRLQDVAVSKLLATIATCSAWAPRPPASKLTVGGDRWHTADRLFETGIAKLALALRLLDDLTATVGLDVSLVAKSPFAPFSKFTVRA